MTQLSLEAIQKQHEELLKLFNIKLLSGSGDLTDEEVSQVNAFLETLAQAGAYIEDLDQRSQLRAWIRYWASFANDNNKIFPVVRLQPFIAIATRFGHPTAQDQLNATATAQANIDATATAVVVPPAQSPFNVYIDAGDPGNHYVPSGFIGDFNDITLTENWTVNPHSGRTCIRVIYSGVASQGKGWAGVYWQDPANNWGKTPESGYNLSNVSKLTFWVRGDVGREQIEIKVGGITGPYGDSLQPAVTTGVITLTKSWQQVTIDLTGKNLTHIIGGFVWLANTTNNRNGATFYLDDIVYLA